MPFEWRDAFEEAQAVLAQEAKGGSMAASPTSLDRALAAMETLRKYFEEIRSSPPDDGGAWSQVLMERARLRAENATLRKERHRDLTDDEVNVMAEAGRTVYQSTTKAEPGFMEAPDPYALLWRRVVQAIWRAAPRGVEPSPRSWRVKVRDLEWVLTAEGACTYGDCQGSAVIRTPRDTGLKFRRCRKHALSLEGIDVGMLAPKTGG